MDLLINAYCTLRQPPALTFPHKLLGSRDRTDPEIASHLEGFIGYAINAAGGQMTQTAYYVMRHIQRVQRQFSFEVVDRDLDAVSQWAWQANAILFLPNGTICDPSGRHLLPNTQETARVPYPADAQERKTRTEAHLSGLGIYVTPTLPPVISDLEVDLRTGSDVARRCLALFGVAVRGESLGAGKPIPGDEIRERLSLANSTFSPTEQEFLNNPAPAEQDAVTFSWRYEALYLLEWALGLTSELPLPTQICDVRLTARLALDNNSREFIDGARLRPTGEILNALDLHYRLQWAIHQARADNREAPAPLLPGVVQERYHALNWLVRFEQAEWDDVDTPA